MFYWGLGVGACHRFLTVVAFFLSGPEPAEYGQTTLYCQCAWLAGRFCQRRSGFFIPDFAEDCRVKRFYESQKEKS